LNFKCIHVETKLNVINDKINRTRNGEENNKSIVPLSPFSSQLAPHSRKDKPLMTKLFEEGANPTMDIF